MDRTSGEIIALRAVEWVLGDDSMREIFLGSTGMAAQDLARSGPTQDLQLAVLEFLAQDDSRVIEFCSFVGIAPENFLAAQVQLPGADLPHWT